MSETNAAERTEDIKLINSFSRRELTEDEVYTFPVVLCDNETDRDYERFSVDALKELGKLFVGRTGIFDHNPKGMNQTARIYSTEIVTEPEKKTSSGEVYTALKGRAYLMRSEKNADFIKDIDGGIKKEVSVSCSVKKRICSICGCDRNSGSCSHIKGRYYSGRLCEIILDKPTDAYEWSFVAVPAQRNAGITKAFSEGFEDGISTKALERKIGELSCDISKAEEDITAEIIRLGQFCVPAYQPEVIKALCSEMDISQLIDFKKKTRSLASDERQESIFAEKKTAEKSRSNGKFKLI